MIRVTICTLQDFVPAESLGYEVLEKSKHDKWLAPGLVVCEHVVVLECSPSEGAKALMDLIELARIDNNTISTCGINYQLPVSENEKGNYFPAEF